MVRKSKEEVKEEVIVDIDPYISAIEARREKQLSVTGDSISVANVEEVTNTEVVD